MMTYTITLDQKAVRAILAEYIAENYNVGVIPERIRFDVKQGYNGEQGGLSYPTEVGITYTNERR